MSIAAAELDSKLAVEMLERVASRGICESSSAVACDCTLELPLPDNFPRPRVYLCLGNTLGGTTTVGAVRLLRIIRTTMGPTDSLVLGLESPAEAAASLEPRDSDINAARHFRALRLINSTVGACFDVARFDFKATFDVVNNRMETHLIARRAFDIEVPGVCDIRLRKGESIRTSVSCRFDRHRVSAMMAGVGLTLREWMPDASARFAVALATPAV
jgi:uncharacterized SAM-dependent methyltransferase